MRYQKGGAFLESIQRYWKRTDKVYLLLCLFSSGMAVLALASWAAKQGNGFAVDGLTGQITGVGDYRRAMVQAGAAAIGIVVAILLSNIDYRSLVNVWPVHVALTWGLVLPTLIIRNVSIGLQNPGVQHFIDVELNEMLELKQKYGTVAIANLGGHSEEEYVEGAAMLSESGVDIVELNISCPNVKVGGMAYGVKTEAAGEVVRMVRDACKKPLMVKLSPQAENIPEMCKAVEAAGADAISLTNTFQACAIDLEKRKPVFNNIFAGLSGPAVRPIALRMVWQAVGAVNIPVVGLGGIATGRDALEFIMAGAAAVQVGAANFANPRAMETIADEMAAWMDKNGVKTLDEIRGCARNAE